MSHQEEIRNGYKRESGKKSNNPLVSIIIPTYNRAHLIGETLDSILAQTYPHWECIVVDDGSTDQTAKVMAGYLQKDSRFKYYHRPLDRPKGANACRNYGFEMSRGEYINWFDSDDLMVEERLEVIIMKIKSCQPNSLLTSQVGIIGQKEPLQKVIEPKKPLYQSYVLEKIKLSTIAPVWPRKLFNKIHLFDESLHQSQEYEFYTRIFYILKEKISLHVINKSLVFIRKSSSSKISKINLLEENYIESYLAARDKILTLISENKKIKRHLLASVFNLCNQSILKKKFNVSKKMLLFIRKWSSPFSLQETYQFLRIALRYYTYLIRNIKFYNPLKINK